MADLKRFFKKTVSEDRHKQAASVSVPEGLWIKCPKCGEMVYREDVISNAYVCPKCGGYFRISAKRRIKMIADKGRFLKSGSQELTTAIHWTIRIIRRKLRI
mgnify:CR=1 FL=1